MPVGPRTEPSESLTAEPGQAPSIREALELPLADLLELEPRARDQISLTVLERTPPTHRPRLGGALTDTIFPGQSTLITFTPDEPGRYLLHLLNRGPMAIHGTWGRVVVE